MALQDNERFYPANPDETFDALVVAVRHLHRYRSADDFSRSVRFATRASGFTWGAQMSAFVMPARRGSIVRVSGRANVRINLTASGAERRRAQELLDEVGQSIQFARAAL